MPGIAGTSPASLEHLGRPLFRAHKSLPRRPNGDPSVHVIHASPSDPIVDTSNGGAHASVPALPLTPPGVPLDESPTPKALEMQKLTSPHSMSGTVTPSRPSHPPTPETTPPRLPATTYRPGIGGQFRQASCSSRAESFQTACEMISDGEAETPHRSSPSSRQSTRQRSLQKSVQSEPKDARLDDATSAVDHSDAMLLKPSRYEGINGEWATENTDRFAASRQRRRRSRNHSSDTPPTANVPEQPQDTYNTSAHDLDVPRTRERNVRVRVRDAQDTGASPYPEQYSEKIDWSSPEGRTDSYNHDDTRRFSGVSTSSTIEVMIVDTPEPYIPSLRHTEKRVSLRSTSSPITRSERGSLVSNPDSQHRLVHKAARISENDRRSIASEMSISEDSTQGGPRQHVEVVPVVVIPERHSSLKSSASTSRKPSNASSQPSSRRTRTRSGSRPESVDRPPQKRRTLSNSSAPTHQDTDCRGRSLGRPIIPPRSSSLSAPTSQNNSRATSLTSVSSRNQPTAVETEKQTWQPEPPMPEPKKAPLVRDRADVLKTQSILIGVEDMAHLRSPSGAFTVGSIPSSSPGLVEISEATLVPFFPHNNESLLLVDPQQRPGAQGLAIRVEYQGSPAKPEFPQSPGQGEVDSPLQNPRQPPNPPVCKVSPPTPVNEADREPERGTGHGETGEQPPRRFGSIRRPWKLRPRSDSFNSIARSFSVTSAKNRMAGKDIDGKLHPFWRPRRFWEDTSESEDQSPREQNFRPPTLEADQIISNSLGMPQQRVVFQGPPISPRSIDTKRSFDEAASRRQARDSLVGSRVFMPEALYSQTSLHQRRYRSLSWWRLRLRFGSVRSFRKRLRRSWQQRAEGKREARREALKQSIGEAVLVDSSTQTRSMVQ
ncbi:hypothetical protein BDV38DRAFT_194929 [Aspergillus pseudotamarii]|uniref:Uncharacterized protein n=1 Tax=Aspergillus pseudotamarii TaxID=132259 RepID=A0A5N6SE98_ASPPS|nr:uncharacterized protein BDV38DRAFT_194929 [Aspergillus pseudotamarii]KAE8133038.1 hypothetical protein BDV38DRAFT_194929 [Aspergillus pseudotamarii]